MLIIGSRAAKFWFNDFRTPNGDWDLVITEAELPLFKEAQILRDDPFKKKYLVQGQVMEVEIVQPYSSWELIYSDRYEHTITVPGVGIANVAYPNILYALKRSHITFPVHWRKNFMDFNFFHQKGFSEKAVDYSSGLFAFFEKRYYERVNLSNTRSIDFNKSNKDFFKDKVIRYIEHDDLHQLCLPYSGSLNFGNKPLFKELQPDPDKAFIDYFAFLNKSQEWKIAFMREEIIVLAMERHLIPAAVAKTMLRQRHATFDIACKMVYHYLPLEFRFFMADHFMEIISKINKTDLSDLACQLANKPRKIGT